MTNQDIPQWFQKNHELMRFIARGYTTDRAFEIVERLSIQQEQTLAEFRLQEVNRLTERV